MTEIDKVKDKAKQYREDHKDEIKERKKKYREEHKEELKIKQQLYRDSLQEEAKEYNNILNAEHKEQHAEAAAKHRIYLNLI